MRNTLNAASWVFAALCVASAAVGDEPPFPHEMQYPNILRPRKEIGTYGRGAGQFIGPAGVAISASDEIFVVDSGNGRVQVFSSDGVPKRSWGRLGRRAGELASPRGIAIGPGADVFVTDTGNGRIKRFNASGVPLTAWRLPEDGARPEPFGIAATDEVVAVTDASNHVVRVFDGWGAPIVKFGGYGRDPGHFDEPTGIAIDGAGHIYVADSQNNRIQKFTSKGKFVTAWGTWGSRAGQFATPFDVAIEHDHVYVSDLLNNRVQVFNASGVFLYQWARHPPTAHEGQGMVHHPTAIAVSPRGGTTIVCEEVENRCQIFGEARTPGAVANAKDSARLDNSTQLHYGAHVATEGTVLAISEPDTHSVLIFDNSVTPPKLLTRIGSQGSSPGQMIQPDGILIDAVKNRVLVSDRGNRRIQLFEFAATDPRRAAIADDRGPGVSRFIRAYDYAKLLEPLSRAVPPVPGLERAEPSMIVKAPDGTIYIADPPNDRIFFFDQDLNVKGVLGGSASGPIEQPTSIALGATNDVLYVVEHYSFRVSAFDRAGRRLFSWGGPGAGPSNFIEPSGIATTRNGNVYVSDSALNTIKVFDANGKFISEWGGWGVGKGEFYTPKGIGVDGRGRLLVSDFANHRCQIFDATGRFIDMFGMGGHP
jgi:DNA-binding beta-propeller fold protein YncE